MPSVGGEVSYFEKAITGDGNLIKKKTMVIMALEHQLLAPLFLHPSKREYDLIQILEMRPQIQVFSGPCRRKGSNILLKMGL